MTRPHRTAPDEPVAPVVDRNIAALIERRKRRDERRTRRERVADAVGRFAGSVTSVYVHAAVFGLWIAINLGVTPIPPFDESLVILAMAASVEAIFLSTFVLMMQNRLAAMSEERAELDLQISLLAEHEITRLLQIADAIAHKLGVELKRDAELEFLKKDVVPEQVLERLDAVESQEAARESSDPNRAG